MAERTIQETIEEIIKTKKKVDELSHKMPLALWLEIKFPTASWPIHTSIGYAKKKYYLRLRDSEDVVKVVDARGVPKAILLIQPNIVKLYKTDKAFKRYVDRR